MLCKIENAVAQHTVGKRTDWERVKRVVIKTCPKCQADVPDMVDWYARFGGGSSKAFIPLICGIFDKHVEHTRQVSGSFFKTIANLKLAADKPTPALFCNGTLVSHAAAKELAVDGYAKFYKGTELESMSVGGKRHDKAMAANEQIARAFKLAKQTGLPDHMLVTPKFRLFDRMSRLVFKYDPNKDTKDVDKDFVTFESIAAEFCKELVQLSPSSETLLSQHTAPSNMEPSAASSSDHANIVEYDEFGVAQSQGAATLASKGFNIGSLVTVLKGKADEQWVIKNVSESGDVSMCRHARDGAEGDVSVFNIGEFTRKFKSSKSEVKMLDKYPSIDAATSADYTQFNLMCVVGTVVYEAARANVNVKFSIQITPIKKVTALAEFAKGDMVLVPATNKIVACKDKGKAIPMDEYTCTLPDEHGEPRYHLLKPQGADYTAVIWKAKVEFDRTKCNCSVDNIEVMYKPPMTDTTATMRKVTLQVVSNFKDISAGDEVVIYKPAHQKAPAAKKPVLTVAGSASEGGAATKKARKA
jgi:hypothetical protein